MSSVGYATLQVIPSLRGMDREIRQQLGGLDQAGQRAGQSSGRGFSNRFTSAVGGLVRSVGRTIETGLTVAGTAAGIGLATALVSGFDRLTTIQDATAALTISLQDSAAAAGLLDDVLDVVRGTPFNLDHFANAAQILVGMGVEAEKIPLFLTAIGEASATQGSRANEMVSRLVDVFGVIQAQGRITMSEVNRIAQTGVNALAILGNEFGVTTEEMRDMISSGAVPAGEAMDALAHGIIDGTEGVNGATVALGGTMESLRDTLTGAKGGFGAAMARLGANILEPFVALMTAGFRTGADLLDILGERAAAFGERLAESPALANFVDRIAGLPDRVDDLADRFRGLEGVLVPLAAAAGAIAASGIAAALGPLGAIVPKIHPLLAVFAGVVAMSPELRATFGRLAGDLGEVARTVLSDLRPVLEQVGPMLVSVAGIVGEAFLRVATAVAPLIPLVADLAITMLDALVPVFEALVDVGVSLVEALSPVVEALLPHLTSAVDALAGPLGEVAGILGGALADALQTLSGPLAMVADVFGVALADAVEHLVPLLPPAAEALGELAGHLAEILAVVLPLVRPLGDLIGLMSRLGLTPLAGMLRASTLALQALNIAIGAVRDGVRLAGDALGWLWDSVLAPLGRGVSGAVTPVLAALGVLLGGPLATAFGKVADAALWLWDSVLKPVGSWLAGTFGPILSGIAGFLSGAFFAAVGLVHGALTGLWNHVLKPVASFLRGAFAGAIDLARGAWRTVESAVEAAEGALNDVLSSARTVGGLFKNALPAAIDLATAAWDGFLSVLSSIAGGLETIVSAAQSAVHQLGQVNAVKAGVVHGGLRALASFHTGGIVGGPAGADVPILAQAGEGVFTRDQMAALGMMIDGGGGGSSEMRFVNGGDAASQFFAHLVRTGRLQMRDGNGRPVKVVV